MTSSPVSLAAALLRIAVGAIMLAHGIQKFLVYTTDGVAGMLGGLGLPLAGFFGVALPAIETAAGVLLILGLFTRGAAVATAFVAFAALFTAHLPAGFFVDAGGVEFVLLLGVSGVAVALLGAGPYGLDRFIGRGGRKATADA